jgi:hypothetical protein
MRLDTCEKESIKSAKEATAEERWHSPLGVGKPTGLTNHPSMFMEWKSATFPPISRINHGKTKDEGAYIWIEYKRTWIFPA